MSPPTSIPNGEPTLLVNCLHMSQGIAEIRHFRKSLDISGNAKAIEEIPELPRQLQKHQAYPEMPRQLRKFEFKLTIFNFQTKFNCVCVLACVLCVYVA